MNFYKNDIREQLMHGAGDAQSAPRDTTRTSVPAGQRRHAEQACAGLGQHLTRACTLEGARKQGLTTLCASRPCVTSMQSDGAWLTEHRASMWDSMAETVKHIMLEIRLGEMPG